MTLNVTILHPHYILQVSDRRLTSIRAGQVISAVDDANKAVILCCADAVLTITYTGLGQFLGRGVDDWLVDALQESGAAELSGDSAVEMLRERANAWFKDIGRVWSGLHVFTIAGWQAGSPPQRRLWFLASEEGATDFEVLACPITKDYATGLIVTGYKEALTDRQRGTIFECMHLGGDYKAVETTTVRAIQSAAQSAELKVVGQDCMAVGILPNRATVARYHPSSGAAMYFGPNVVWYHGGRNWAVKDMHALPSGEYALAVGGDAGTRIVVGLGPGEVDESKKLETHTSMANIRMMEARHRNDPIGHSDIFGIVRVGGALGTPRSGTDPASRWKSRHKRRARLKRPGNH
jgi:hypothetical protein